MGIYEKAGKAVRGVVGKVKENAIPYLKDRVLNDPTFSPIPGVQGNPVAAANKGWEFYKGVFGAQAAENPQAPVLQGIPGPNGEPPQQDMLGGLLGGIGDFFGGIGSAVGGALGGVGAYAQANPALFTGITTGLLGASQGVGGLDAAGMGGQQAVGIQNELQRRLEKSSETNAKLLGGTTGAGLGTLDVLNKELDLYGSKLSPEQRQQYVSLRLAGKRPTYNNGIMGIGAKFE